MSTVYPFRALRPRPDDVARVAAVPYDVVTTSEARALAEGNPQSFLRVSRPELELPTDVDPYSDAVYARAKANFEALRTSSLVLETEPSVYFYRLQMGDHVQTGLAACYSIDEYDRDLIRKHERTRRDKEDDRTKHMLALGAQTGPVFLTYRANAAIDAAAADVTTRKPLFAFTAADGVSHTMWRVTGGECEAVVAAFRQIPALYIADGHHRAASAARTRRQMADLGLSGANLGDGADFNTVLAVAFPDTQMRVLAYNRIVKDLAGLAPDAFLAAVRERFTLTPGPASPLHRGEIAMYFDNSWSTLVPRVRPAASDVIGSLDVSVLQDQLLEPILKIADVRTDKRIDFVGGIRGTAPLEALVRDGRAAVAFSLFPVGVDDLMAVSDAGAIMPPKSTWFEPKLRDGLLIHVI
jgi:uncharacterized protein (DUF1015 family)